MPVTEQLQATGSWSISLRPDTPASVTDLVNPSSGGFSHIIVTSTWLDARLLNEDRIFQAALWTGVLMRAVGRTQLSGSGAATWLGGENGDGDFGWNWVATPTTLAGAVSSLLSTWNALGIGNPMTAFTAISSITATRSINSTGGGTLRERVELLCRHYNVEWRVTPSLALQFGTADDLYGASPPILLSPLSMGPDNRLRGMQATIEASTHLEDYATAIGATNSTTTTYSVVTAPYLDVNGNAVRRTRKVSVSDTATAELGNVATALHAPVDQPAYSVAASTNEYAATEWAPVGSWAWLWDPDQGVLDTANRVTWRGETINPVKVRVVGCSWPVRRGMGVYARLSDASGTLVDLTDWIEPETGDARIELGDPFPTLSRTFQSFQRII
jgi:hypothetical protein